MTPVTPSCWLVFDVFDFSMNLSVVQARGARGHRGRRVLGSLSVGVLTGVTPFKNVGRTGHLEIKSVKV